MPRKTRPKPSPGGSGAKGQRTDMVKPAAAPPTQPPAAPTGMTYGAHQESIQSQEQMPLPATPPTPALTPSAGAGDSPGGEGAQPQGGFGAVLQAALQAPSPDNFLGLGAPTTMPGQPIQAGLSSGPGAGPSVQPARAADVLDRLALSSGDPELANLAAMARRVGA